MNTLHLKMKEEFTFQSDIQILKIDLELPLSCNLHTIGNHRAKYEHPQSKKMKEELAFQAVDRF